MQILTLIYYPGVLIGDFISTNKFTAQAGKYNRFIITTYFGEKQETLKRRSFSSFLHLAKSNRKSRGKAL